MKLCLNMFINTTTSIRSLSKVFKEFSSFIPISTASNSCIREWVLRMGLGILKQDIQKRNDWVYIIDFSIQLGSERCLLILGVTKKQLNNEGYVLSHQMVQVIDIYVQSSFKAQRVNSRLEAAATRTGTPCQIISDRGVDVKKGIEMFIKNNEEVISTYDITHLIGLEVKHALQKDLEWIGLQKELLSITQQTKQTELSFLRPVSMGLKSRWLNIDKLTIWLERIFQYEAKSDFSLINNGVKIQNHEYVYERMKGVCKNSNHQRSLKSNLKKKIFKDERQAEQWLKEKGFDGEVNVVFEDAGKIRFYEKYNGLINKKAFCLKLIELCRIIKQIKSILKTKGLSKKSLEEIEKIKTEILYPLTINVYDKIVNQLKLQKVNTKPGYQPILCCSDVIESIFGKFKVKMQQSVGGIYQTVLVISLICTKITARLIEEVMLKIKMHDVDEWFYDMMGQTNLAKRKRAFIFT